MRILLIEDNEGMRVVLRRYLDPLAVPIEEAKTLAEGLEIMRKIPPPDLVFLDLWLPDTVNAEATLRDGLGAIRSINPNAVVVVMTGDSADSIARAAVEFGADAFRHKLQMDSQAVLWGVVKSALEGRRDSGKGLVQAGQRMIEQLAGLLALDHP